MFNKISAAIFAKIINDSHYLLINGIIQSPTASDFWENTEKWISDLITPLANCLQKFEKTLEPFNIVLASGILEDYLSSALKYSGEYVSTDNTIQPEPPKEGIELKLLFQWFHLQLKNEELQYAKLYSQEELNDLADKFKPWLDSLPLHAIDSYQLKSFTAAVKTSLYKTKALSTDLAVVLNHKGKNITSEESKLLSLICRIQTITGFMTNEEPDDYLKESMNSFKTILSEHKHTKEFGWLLSSLENYLYQRTRYQESLFYNANNVKRCEELLNKHHMSGHSCSAFEESLLIAAGIKIPPNLVCLTNPSSSEINRYEIEFVNLSITDVQKFIEYISQFDKTAELHESAFYPIPEESEIPYLPKEKTKTVTITLNPQAVYNNIHPIFVKTLSERIINKDPRIQVYQKESEEYLKKESKEKENGAEIKDTTAQNYNLGFFDVSTSSSNNQTNTYTENFLPELSQ